jgi:hypothetical protein
MRSKNSRPIDALEEAWLHAVKNVPCVFCDHPAPSEAHHVKQGRHYLTVAACKDCHQSKAWKLGHPNEFDAINETHARIWAMRLGLLRGTLSWEAMQKDSKRSTRTPTKIIPRSV